MKCAFFRNDLPGSESDKPGQFVSILVVEKMFRWCACLNDPRSVQIFWTVFGLLADQCPDNLEIVRMI